MSDGKGPTFDQEFDDFDRELRQGIARFDALRTFMVTVRSEMCSRQRAFDDLLTERAGLIGARAGAEARAKGLTDLDRQRFDALRDDYEKVQVALASTRLAMVEMDRVTRERNEAREELASICDLLGAKAGAGIAENAVISLAEQSEKIAHRLMAERDAARSLLREMANHPCTAHDDVWQRARDLLAKAEEVARG